MRTISLTSTLVCLLLAAYPAFAGTIEIQNGQGGWKSTQCEPPLPPSAMPRDPEADANDLNSRIILHNQFAAATQDYMNCLSEEARRDANSSIGIISRDSAEAIMRAKAQVDASAAQLQSKQ